MNYILGSMQTNFVVYTVDTIAFQRSLSVLICIIVMNNKRYPNASVPSLHFSTPSSYVILPLIPMCSVHSAGCLVLLLRSRNLQSSELLTSPRLSRIAYPRARNSLYRDGCGLWCTDCRLWCWRAAGMLGRQLHWGAGVVQTSETSYTGRA